MSRREFTARRWLSAVVAAVACWGAVLVGSGGAADHVLVVANGAVPESVEIARRYLATRAIPQEQLLTLKTTAATQISRAEFDREIHQPIADWLAAHRAQDRILYIVLTRGIPLRVAGTSGREGTVASVDSELTLLYRRLTGIAVPLSGPVANPYFLGTASIDTAQPFTRAVHDTYLVTRLDGFTAEDAVALIERAGAAANEGRILLDEPATANDVRSRWFETAVERLRSLGLRDRTVRDETSRALLNEADVIGYSSWGSNDPALSVRHPNLTFRPGAIAAMFLGMDARTFIEPAAAWTPGASAALTKHAGSNQMLIGDFVRSGVTGIAGQVSEPFLDGAIRPDILFPAYVSGRSLAEAFYLGMPYLSWQTVVVGDPLCAPFATSTRTETAVELDAETELPVVFSARRFAALRSYHRSIPALKRFLRAESRMARSDFDGALESLRDALDLDATMTAAWHLRAEAHGLAGQHAEAQDAYKRVLALEPNHVAALNNLAYTLAVHSRQPQEALRHATRAAILTKGQNALVNDTVGWIHHLLGNTAEAVRLLRAASEALPSHPDVQFHAAAAYAAAGRLDDAARALKAAETLNPDFRSQPEFLEIQRRIGKGGSQ